MSPEPPLTLLLALLLPALAQPVPDGRVTVPLATWRALQPPVDRPEQPPGPHARDRVVRLSWDREVLKARVRWRMEAPRAEWLTMPLAGPGWRVEEVRLDGRPVPAFAQGDRVYALARIEGPSRLEARLATLADPTRGAVPLALMPAVIGTVTWDVPEGLVGRVTSGGAVDLDGTTWTGHPALSVSVGPPAPPAADRRTLAVGRVGLGLTVGEGAVDGRARVRWAVRQGALRQVGLRVRGVGDDLELTGPNVARWSRSGDRVRVELRQPAEGLAEIELRWSIPVPDAVEGRLTVPTVVPDGVFRTESSLQIARDAALEILPEVPRWQAVAAVDLPDWGEGLVAGTPTAAYTAGGTSPGGQLALLRFVPVEQPPVMVDVAALTVSVSAEGRTLTRAAYTVRNERASHLRIRPQPGATIVGARVQDGPVTPVADGGDWLIPLPRSLETIDGLLSFPVEVILLGDGTPWARREARDLPLPGVDAEVAVQRVTLHLPRGWEPRLEPGEHGIVPDFTEGEGIAYGFGLGGADEAEADQLWQEAQAAYMRNDFDAADAKLDALESLGASNENLGRLRSNLDVVQGRGEAGNAMARRVREQASSRAADDYRRQADLIAEADEALAAGEYDKAESTYEQAEQLSRKLDKLEQAESVEQDRMQSYASGNMAVARAEKKKRRKLSTRDLEEEAEDPRSAFARQAEAKRLESEAVLDESVSQLQDLMGSGAVPPQRLEEMRERLEALQERRAELAERDRVLDELAVDGVEGGVVGGVVGGVMGGQVAADASPAEEASRWDAPVEVPEDIRGVFGVSADDADGVSGSLTVEGRGASAGAAAPVDAVPESEPARRRTVTVERESLERMPTRDVSAVTESVAVQSTGRGGGGRSRRRGGIRRAEDAAPPPPAAAPAAEEPAPRYEERTQLDFEDLSIEGELQTPSASLLLDAKDKAPADTRAPLEVTSTRLSVVVPVLGETLKYQNLLLPAGAAPTVHVEARADRSVPRRTR